MIEFYIKDFVYLITDKDQSKRIITGIHITEGDILYNLSYSDGSSWHYGYEIAKEQDLTIKYELN